VVGDDREQSVFAFLRHGHEGTRPVLVVCNFTPVPRYNYRVGVPGGDWAEIFNSDMTGYGGGGIGNGGTLRADGPGQHGQECSIELKLPPLATIILHREM